MISKVIYRYNLKKHYATRKQKLYVSFAVALGSGRHGFRSALADFGRHIGNVLVRIALLTLPLYPQILSANDKALIAAHVSEFDKVNDRFIVDDTFSSHLPLLVIEPGRNETAFSPVSARLTVHADDSGQNSMKKSPGTVLNVLLTVEGNENEAGKKTYSVKLASQTDDVSEEEVSLVGLPKAGQWRLHGSAQDKGMLRNGLAYTFGRILFPDDTPETRYCEVLFKVDGRYHYQGLYILAESVAQTFQIRHPLEDGSFLLEYSPKQDLSRQNASLPGGEKLFLSKTLNDRGFFMIHPPQGNTAVELRAESELDSLESVLHSLTPGTFMKYLSMLEQDSAIDLYILNEMLLNAEASAVSFYLAGKKRGPLRFQPVWNFDQALDNVPIRTDALALEEKLPDISTPSILSRRIPVWRQLENGGDISDLRLYPLYVSMDGDRFVWFDRLFLSRPFLVGILDRYHALRRGPLSPEKVAATVDALARELGPALERDWRRWSDIYDASEGPGALAPFTDAKGERFIRQTASYDQELVKIRYLLRRQDSLFMEQINQMDQLSADLFDRATSGNFRAGYALATVIAFLFLTYLLTRKV